MIGSEVPTLAADGRCLARPPAFGALLAVPSGAGDYLYPAGQFTPEGVLAGLDEFLRAFPDAAEDPWTQLSVLLAPASSLGGRSALDALRAGDVAGARGVARTFGEHGA
jgi:hypothetical protein